MVEVEEDSKTVVKIEEFMRQSDGARVIAHTPIDGSNEAENLFFGIYSVDTGFGNVDRTFSFEDGKYKTVEDCFEGFKSEFQKDITLLREKIEEEKVKSEIVTPDNLSIFPDT